MLKRERILNESFTKCIFTDDQRPVMVLKSTCKYLGCRRGVPINKHHYGGPVRSSRECRVSFIGTSPRPRWVRTVWPSTRRNWPNATPD